MKEYNELVKNTMISIRDDKMERITVEELVDKYDIAHINLAKLQLILHVNLGYVPTIGYMDQVETLAQSIEGEILKHEGTHFDKLEEVKKPDDYFKYIYYTEKIFKNCEELGILMLYSQIKNFSYKSLAEEEENIPMVRVFSFLNPYTSMDLISMISNKEITVEPLKKNGKVIKYEYAIDERTALYALCKLYWKYQDMLKEPLGDPVLDEIITKRREKKTNN